MALILRICEIINQMQALGLNEVMQPEETHRPFHMFSMSMSMFAYDLTNKMYEYWVFISRWYFVFWNAVVSIFHQLHHYST